VLVEAEVVLLPVGIVTVAEAVEEEPLLGKRFLPNPFPPH